MEGAFEQMMTASGRAGGGWGVGYSLEVGALPPPPPPRGLDERERSRAVVARS